MPSRSRRLLAEFLGTALLAAVVVGSGIAAERLSPHDTGLALLENALATALGLGVIIVILGPVSGAHLNPVISLVDAILGRRRWGDALSYIPAQVLGCAAGAILANLMFGGAAVSISTNDRLTPAHLLSEAVATAGLVLVVFLLAAHGQQRFAPVSVGAYIGAAYFFTSSTGFANPAITVGRMLTDTFSGIAPSSAPAFIAAQVVGGVLGLGLVRLLAPTASASRAAQP
ncbi:MAG TPA: MIP/aquaporin family protein [Pseudolysinimonas sp.]|nr:MIP/aquaporin family protein [Pseudolysinimonas sp.]